MKKIGNSMILVLMSSFVVLSCMQEESLTPVSDGQMTFNVIAEKIVEPSSDLKSVIVKDDKGKHSILWSAEDVIKVYNELKAEGDDYTLTGTAGSSSASFTGPKTEGAEEFYAAYPSVEGSSCANGTFTGLVVPSTQTAVKGTFPTDAYVSVAAADNENNFQFRNACALIKLVLGTEYAYVKQIVIEDKDGEAALAGTFSCTLGNDGITMGEVTDASKSITLLPPTGLDAFEPGVYYVSCLPESLSGIKLTCTTVLDDAVSKSGGSIELQKNMVLLLPEVNEYSVALPVVPADKSHNSYLVTPGEAVTFTKRRAGIISLELAWQDASNLISRMSIDNETGYVTVLTNNVAGNALVLGKDANGKTLWSWHIWSVDFDPEQTAVEVDGVTFMDRNLGAISATPGEIGTIGQAYQWGRKDPLPRIMTISYSSNTSGTLSMYDIKGNVIPEKNEDNFYFFISTSGDMSMAIENPQYFIIRDDDTFAWWTKDVDYKDFWGGVSKVKTDYDPCPEGWKVPIWTNTDVQTTHPYYFLTDEEKSKPSAENDKDFHGGYLYSKSDTEKLWFPLTGQRSRSQGIIHRPGQDGNYWIGTDKDDGDKYDDGGYIQFHLTKGVGLNSYPNRVVHPGMGCAVRCVKE